jgi:hypothetical protein
LGSNWVLDVWREGFQLLGTTRVARVLGTPGGWWLTNIRLTGDDVVAFRFSLATKQLELTVFDAPDPNGPFPYGIGVSAP